MNERMRLRSLLRGLAVLAALTLAFGAAPRQTLPGDIQVPEASQRINDFSFDLLKQLAMETPGNLDLMRGWIAKWEPLAYQAIDAYCAGLPDVADAAVSAKRATRELHQSMGL